MKLLKLVRGRINKTMKPLASLLGNNLAFGEQNQTSVGQVRGGTAEGNTQAVILLFKKEQIQALSGNVTFWRATWLEKENLLIALSIFLSMGVHSENIKFTPDLEGFHSVWGTFIGKGPGILCPFAWRAAPPLEGTNWDSLCGLGQCLGLPGSPWLEGWDKGSKRELPSFPRQCLPLQELSWACYYPVLLKENSKGSSPGFMWGGYFYLWKTFPVYN